VKKITQHVHGKLFADNGRNALLLTNPEPKTKAAASLYLCFALVVQGPEEHILPALVLDDWGNQRRDLAVYDWLEAEGHRFPRTEIFGFDVDGSETQCFLRALELYVKLPIYVYQAANAPVAAGILLDAILLPDEAATTAQKTKRPSSLPRPLAKARVSWWQVNPTITDFDFSGHE